MELDPGQYSEADRRPIDPPIQVEMATWSNAGQLDWWVKEHRQLGMVRPGTRCRRPTAVDQSC